MEDSAMLGTSQFLLIFWNTFVHPFLEVDECLSDSTVQGYHRRCAVSLTADGTELKAVTREGER